jgi:hypothetical protein
MGFLGTATEINNVLSSTGGPLFYIYVGKGNKRVIGRQGVTDRAHAKEFY